MFYIGQKVVCVNDRFPPVLYEFAFQIPKKGHIYTVREKQSCVHAVTGNRGLGLHFRELHNPSFETRGEPWFAAWRFRPWLDENSEEACVEITEPLVMCLMSCERGIRPLAPQFRKMGHISKSL
jgi:hypothetical protein